MIEINEREKELFKRIADVDNGISKIYNNLFKLDLEAKKDSEEYLDNLEYLRISKGIEDRLYEDLNLDYDKALFMKRMLDYKIQNNYIQTQSTRIDGYLTSIVYPDIKLENIFYIDLENLLNDVNMIAENICNEYLGLLVYNYNKCSKDKNYEVYKHIFLSSMYITLFNNKDIEDRFLKSNFDFYFPSKLNICAYLELFGHNKYIIDQLYDDFFIDIIQEAEECLGSSGKIDINTIQFIPALTASLTMLNSKNNDLDCEIKSDNNLIQYAYENANIDKNKTTFVKLKK